MTLTSAVAGGDAVLWRGLRDKAGWRRNRSGPSMLRLVAMGLGGLPSMLHAVLEIDDLAPSATSILRNGQNYHASHMRDNSCIRCQKMEL